MGVMLILCVYWTALNALVEHLHKSDYAIVEKPRKREKVRQ